MDCNAKKVVGLPDGRIVLKNVKVSESLLSLPTKGCFKQTFFSLKPIEKTFNFAKDRFMREKEKKDFGSSPNVNIIVQNRACNSYGGLANGKLSRSDREINKIVHTGMAVGRKYALVQLNGERDQPVRFRGRDVHHRAASIEDGLGMLATATNDLISYERTPPHNMSSSFYSRNRKSEVFHGSQFTPEWEMDQGFRRPPAVLVRPEYIKKNSSGENSDVKIQSIEKSEHYYDNEKLTPMQFYTRTQRRQSLHDSTLGKFESSITGSNSSTPRKSASVLDWPGQVSTTAIRPQERSSETPEGTTTTSESSPGLDQVVFRRTSNESTSRAYSNATTFGTDPRSRTYSSSNLFSAEPVCLLNQSETNQSPNLHRESNRNWEENTTTGSSLNHSPMSSGNSSTTTTTMNQNSGIPTIFGQNGANKIAVAPQPQKKLSYRKEEKESHRHHHRSSMGPSPYQVVNTPHIPTSKSANKIHRLSNEVFIDGPTPTPVGDGQTDVRVSYLEDRVRDLERGLSRSSRQNLIFSPSAGPSEAQQLMMQDLIDKNVLIGQLEARVRTLASQLERQQMTFDEERKAAERELTEARRGYSSNKKKIQSLQEQLDNYEKLYQETMKRKEDELLNLTRELRQKEEELVNLNSKFLASTKVSDEVTVLQSQLSSKDSRIAELEALVTQLKEMKPVDRNHNTKSFTSGVETLSEVDEASNDEDGELFSPTARSGNVTPTPKATISTSIVVEKPTTVLPNNFNVLLRNHYRRTQICHDLASNLVEATGKLLEGRNNEAAKLLGYFTDTEAEDSEALVSETPSTLGRMTVGTAEKYLRKECDMLEKVEKKLTTLRSEYFNVCRTLKTKEQPNCRMQ
ncbi:hypothetical protein FO519_000110 [Halicephalobus sp. NKZ332]|nr:hypothetical protein FO519_000110 [Halicephalobus sp. NKZ332]